MAGRTISSPKGSGDMNHNNRKFLTKNVDASRVHLNRCYVREDLRVAYDKLFGEAVGEYNSRVKDKHPEQVIRDYLDKITRDKSGKGKGKKPFYETIFQIGDMFDTNVRDEAASAPAIAALDEFARSFQERNPNLYVFNMTLHLDEQTPHLHVDYIPVAREMKRGMKVQNSLARALREQGIVPEGEIGRLNNETMTWQARERACLKELAENQGIEIISPGIQRRNYSLPEYKAAMREADQILEGAEVEASEIRADAERDRQAAADERATTEAEVTQIRDKAQAEADRIMQEASRSVAEYKRRVEAYRDEEKRVQGKIEAQNRLLLGNTKSEGVEIVEVPNKIGYSHFYAATRDKDGRRVPINRKQLDMLLKSAAKLKEIGQTVNYKDKYDRLKDRFDRFVERLERLIAPKLPEALQSVWAAIRGDREPEKPGIGERLAAATETAKERERAKSQYQREPKPSKDLSTR